MHIRRAYLHAAGVPIDHDLKPYAQALAAVEAIETASLSDAALAERATAAREAAASGRPLDDLLPEVFALVREASARLLGLRPFDVQVEAAVALHRGRLAQLATGEGKTLVAVMPAVLNALTGRGVHVFTANDYLAERDAGWMGPVYRFFGLTPSFVGQRLSGSVVSLWADVTYVTAKEAGFDFLRDHTAAGPADLVQRPPHFAIVDEADFILIDEARVPLVIAGAAPDAGVDHRAVAEAAEALVAGRDFDADEYERTVVLTEAGFAHASRLLGADLTSPDRRLRSARCTSHCTRAFSFTVTATTSSATGGSNWLTSSPAASPTTGGGPTASTPPSRRRKAWPSAPREGSSAPSRSSTSCAATRASRG